MNPIRFAMRNPITMLMLALALAIAGTLAAARMRVDIFPEFDLPQLYIAINYNGMSPAQVEALLVSQIETELQYVDGIKNLESRNIQQTSLMVVSFHPGTNMAEATAAVVAEVNRAQAFMPAGVLPPQVMRMDAGSVPVGYLVLESKDRKVSLGRLADLAQQRIRPLVQKLVPGTVGIAPFGSNLRSIVVSVDPDRLRSYNLTLEHVTDAIMNGNVVIPAGNLYVKESMPMMPTNAMAENLEQIRSIRLRKDHNVYVRDVAVVSDSTDLDYGRALVNGKRSVYIPIVKKNTTSTLTVVDDVHKAMSQFQQVLNSEEHDKDGNPLIDVEYAFDESSTVVEAIRAVVIEGVIGAALTGLMVLIFLRDWRSVIVVVVNIPLALLGSMFALWATGNTTNIMTLGGLALAIGILVDEATVAVECIHAQMAQVATIPRAVCLGNDVTAVPRLLAMLCVLSVFIPAFIMAEPVRSLFVPLSLAVGFSMIASYLLSSTLVPVLATLLLEGPKVPEVVSGESAPSPPTPLPQGGEGSNLSPPPPQRGEGNNLSPLSPRGRGVGGEGEGGTPTGADEEWLHKGFFGRIQRGFIGFVRFSVRWRWIVLPAYLAACLLVIVSLGTRLGRELFPVVDQGEFVLRYHMPPGTNHELTRQAWRQCLQVIEQEAGRGNVQTSMGFAGQQAPDFPVNNMVLFMSGPDDGQIRVRLREDSGISVAALQERLRRVLPERLQPWLADVLRRQGYADSEALERAGRLRLCFEPGDVVGQVMSFGSPTPIEVVIACPRWNDDAYAYVDGLLAELKTRECLRDVQIRQTLDYPIVDIRIDRQKANLSGITAGNVGDSLVAATSSSRMLYRNYWIDNRLGASYQVQVQMPVPRMTSAQQLEDLPLEKFGTNRNLLLRDVAEVSTGFMPGEVDRTAMQRFLSIIANVEGEDLGRAARQIDEAIARVDSRAEGRPVGVTVVNRGQVKPMHELFASLGIGLGWSVFVIFVMLTAYFQSPRLAFASLGAVPGVLGGVVVILYLTNTTLNIEAFMGTIMSVGVSVSNSVMLVTFIGMVWEKGMPVR